MEFVLETKKFGKQIVLVDDEDAWLMKTYRWYLWSSSRHKGVYVVASECKQNPKEIHYKGLHRMLMKAEGKIVDHINGNPLDNRKQNLRITTSYGNNQNTSKRKNALGKYKGVHFSTASKKYKAQIQCNKIKYSLGSFINEIDAAKAYDKKAKELFGEFAKLNFPEEK